MGTAFSDLRREVLKSPFVAVHGAGECGRETAAMLRAQGANVRCFIDRAARQDEIDALPVQTPDVELPAGAIVVVAIFNYAVDSNAVRKQWRGRGVRAIGFVEFFRAFESELRPRYWLQSSYEIAEEHINPPLDASGWWADDVSRELFETTLRFRMWGESAVTLPAPDMDNAYFPRDLPLWNAALSKPLRFVDCGAFDGDTLRDMARRVDRKEIAVEAIAAFEPDDENYAKLLLVVQELWASTPVLTQQGGVWHREETLFFAAGTGASSALQESGNVVVPCVALDNVLRDWSPNVLKMDIEGAEPQALEGARGIIEAYRPALAICVYHQPEHLWTIAQTLREWNLCYEFHLRSHGFNGFDTVLYAIPS